MKTYREDDVREAAARVFGVSWDRFAKALKQARLERLLRECSAAEKVEIAKLSALVGKCQPREFTKQSEICEALSEKHMRLMDELYPRAKAEVA